MFAGIDESRPWPKTGMTSEKWLDVPTRAVQLRQLTLTQDGIYLKPLLHPETPVGGDRHPHVVQWKISITWKMVTTGSSGRRLRDIRWSSHGFSG
jgi:hypothetical protein